MKGDFGCGGCVNISFFLQCRDMFSFLSRVPNGLQSRKDESLSLGRRNKPPSVGINDYGFNMGLRWREGGNG